MPPCTRRAAAAEAPADTASPAASPAAAPAASATRAVFASLPEPLALQIFGLVGGPKTRHAALPMVCRRWNELCYSPELLRQLVVHVRGSLEPDDYDYGEGSVCRRLQTFFSWLLGRRGAVRHVQRLELSMLKSRYFVNHDEHSPSEVHRFFETVHSCMRALNQAGAPLQELALHTHVVGFGLYSDELSRLGPSLRRLHACALAEEEWFENDIWCEARLQECTALLDLRLTAFHLALQEAVRLPPSLTSLALGREVVSELGLGVPLPQLLAPLTRLRRLGLRGLPLDGIEMGDFGSSLQALAMRDCGALPAGITRLSNLDSLAWENSHQMEEDTEEDEDMSAAAADEALSHLTRLTFLSLMTLEGEEDTAQLPPSLSGLSRLHTASLLSIPHHTMPLPVSGPLLTSLRRLVLSPDSAAASLPALSAMPHLEWLSLTTCGDALILEGYQSYPYYDELEWQLESEVQAWAALEAWAADRPQPAPRLERDLDLCFQVAEQTMARQLIRS